jgi:arsenite-transporting ATPase
VFADHDAAAVLHDRLTQELTVDDGSASLRLHLPFAERGDVSLKKIGLELVVRVDGHKRTIVLPGALASFKPISATLEEGSLVVGFENA